MTDRLTSEPVFVSAERAAEILGFKAVETVRRLSRESGIRTLLERNRIAFTVEQIDELAEWIKHRHDPPANDQAASDPWS